MFQNPQGGKIPTTRRSEVSGYVYIVLAIVFAAVLFITVFYGASALSQAAHDQILESRREESKNALKELEARYARGEIDREEFERMKKDIEESDRKSDRGLWLPPGMKR